MQARKRARLKFGIAALQPARTNPAAGFCTKLSAIDIPQSPLRRQGIPAKPHFLANTLMPRLKFLLDI
jgi:hypothetical protein